MLAKKISLSKKVASLTTLGVLLVAAIGVPIVQAQTAQIQDLRQQITEVQNDSEQKRQAESILSVEASSLNDALGKLQSTINDSQARIGQLQGDVDSLNSQILAAEAELARQKQVLGDVIKSVYQDDQISTLELLATSNDLSEFFDKQQYRISVQSNIEKTLGEIKVLRSELDTKRLSVETTLSEQRELDAQLSAQRAEQNQILALNESQQNELESQILANNGKLAELKKKQAEAEAILARALSSGSYRTSPVGPVASGDIVGAIGNTGLSSGPHLHLETRSGGGVTNPSSYIKSSPVSIPPARISQGYGVANSLYRTGYHGGIDYAASSGTPIKAIDNGQMYRGCSNELLGTSRNDYGYVAIVEHANGVRSIYAHMSGGPAACNYNTYY